jgi:Fic family protein
MSSPPALFTDPAVLGAPLPEGGRSTLAELTGEILSKSGQLAGLVPAAVNRTRIRLLVQEMNSYYSNLIEGHKTLPRDIERALAQDYSADESKRANQHLARAHIEVEQAIERQLLSAPETSIHSPDFLCWIHRELYGRLPEEQQMSKSKRGVPYRIEPGALRTFEVDVGAHQPPSGALPRFMERFGAMYSSPEIVPTEQLIALASGHHRLAWIHPFGDGNGRAARLHSHAWLIRQRVAGFGFWTLSRGLARRRSEYYRRLAGADRRRLNDTEGRGHLSDRGLVEFCHFLLGTMLDQIEFMAGLLDLANLSRRMERHLQFDLVHLEARERERLTRLLKAALFEGEIPRGRVGEIVGLKPSASRAVIQLAEQEGLMNSASPKGPLALRFTSQHLDSYFPQLFQDLPLECEEG